MAFGATVNSDRDHGVRGKDLYKIKEWYAALLGKTLEYFKKGMRLTRVTFDWVVTEVSPLLERDGVGLGKPQISAERRIAAPIW